ncbi:MAG: AbrB/MazE/SpoVT family DNA-binding domain-containing protein [Terracidiphilus sp.]
MSKVQSGQPPRSAVVVIGKRGRITVPVEIRKCLDLGPGDSVGFRQLDVGFHLSKYTGKRTPRK